MKKSRENDPYYVRIWNRQRRNERRNKLKCKKCHDAGEYFDDCGRDLKCEVCGGSGKCA